jgi:hypothetical protein
MLEKFCADRDTLLVFNGRRTECTKRERFWSKPSRTEQGVIRARLEGSDRRRTYRIVRDTSAPRAEPRGKRGGLARAGTRTSRTPGLVARTTRPGRAAAPGQSELLRRGARMWRRTTASQPLPAASLRRAAVRARPRCGFEFVHVQLLRTPICIAVVVAVMNRIIAG